MSHFFLRSSFIISTKFIKLSYHLNLISCTYSEKNQLMKTKENNKINRVYSKVTEVHTCVNCGGTFLVHNHIYTQETFSIPNTHNFTHLFKVECKHVVDRMNDHFSVAIGRIQVHEMRGKKIIFILFMIHSTVCG